MTTHRREDSSAAICGESVVPSRNRCRPALPRREGFPGAAQGPPVEVSRQAFAYVFEGSGVFRGASDPGPVRTEHVNADGSSAAKPAGNRSLVLFDRGDEVTVQAGPDGIRFLLVSGEPLHEPVAWAGPIVMNTQEELRQAYAELRLGTFIRR